jgi:hypothetical protein
MDAGVAAGLSAAGARTANGGREFLARIRAIVLKTLGCRSSATVAAESLVAAPLRCRRIAVVASPGI